MWTAYRLGQEKLKMTKGRSGASPTEWKDPLDEAAQERRDLMAAKKQMDEFIDLFRGVLNRAPAGMKEYIEFNLDALKASDKALEIADKHATKIELALEQIDKLFAQNNRSNTVKTGDISGFDDKYKRTYRQDLNKSLDDILGRPK